MTADPLDQERREFFPAVHDSGAREAPCIAYLVLHDGEVPGGDGADELIGGWFDNPASSGSAHVGVDDDTTQRFLEDDVEAWGAPPLNDSGLHLEQGGYASWTRATWLKHEAMIERAGWKFADWIRTHSIPNRFLSTWDLVAAGANPAEPQGWTTHANVSDAFGQSSHWDPGTGYPLDVLQGYINTYLEDPMTQDEFNTMLAKGLGVGEGRLEQFQFAVGMYRRFLGNDKPSEPEQAAGWDAEDTILLGGVGHSHGDPVEVAGPVI
jgi:hypothetical protein